MKKLKFLMLPVICLLLCGCHDNNQIVMVTEAGFAPYEFYQNKEIVGVDVEIAKLVAQKLDKDLVIKDVAFDSIINELQKGKADFAAAGMSITPERAEQVDFSIEYATSKQVVVVKVGSDIVKPNQIYDKRVGVQLGSVADLSLSEEMNSDKLIRQKKYLSLVEDLRADKIDAIVMDSLPAGEIIKANFGLKILDDSLFTDKYGMAVKKGNTELLDVLNEVLTQAMQEGKIEEWTINYSK